MARGRRTPTLNTFTEYGSMLSETLVKVALVAVVGGAFVLIVRRWHDGVFLALAVSLESTVFVIASFIVDRDRPPVEQLDPPAPSGSFPSGHAGAAVAFYVGLCVVVCWHTCNRIVRAIFVVVAVAAPLTVASPEPPRHASPDRCRGRDAVWASARSTSCGVHSPRASTRSTARLTCPWPSGFAGIDLTSCREGR